MRKTRSRFLLSVVCTLGMCAYLEAHATLLRTTPAANARVEQAPARVELFFNEGIEPIFNSMRVFNRNGFRVDAGDFTLTPNARQMSVGLRPDLPRGVYTIDWRATSGDGHQIGGHFGFAVGEEFVASDTDAGQSGTSSRLPAPGTALARWLYFAGLSMLFGGFSFGALVLNPSLRHTPDGANLAEGAWRPFTRILGWSWLLLTASALMNLLFKAAAMADVNPLLAASPETLRGVIALTQYGRMWGIGFLLTVLAGAVVWLHAKSAASGRPLSSLLLWIGCVIGVGVSVTVSNSGHAAAMLEGRGFALAADSLHVMGTVVWVGGLVHLGLLMRRLAGTGPEFYPRLMGRVLPVFSNLAMISVAVILTTGVYTAWQHMPSWSAFLTTLYGKTLLAKLILVVPLLVTGAVNLFLIKPQLRKALAEAGDQALQTGSAILRRFRPLVRAEVVLAAGVLLVVTVLTNVPPASTEVFSGPVLVDNRTDLDLKMTLKPNRAGNNTVEVSIREKDGRIPAFENVLFVINMATMDMGTERIEVHPQPDGRYLANVVLGMAGMWKIDFRTVRKGTSTPLTATFQVEVGN